MSVVLLVSGVTNFKVTPLTMGNTTDYSSSADYFKALLHCSSLLYSILYALSDILLIGGRGF